MTESICSLKSKDEKGYAGSGLQNESVERVSRHSEVDGLRAK